MGEVIRMYAVGRCFICEKGATDGKEREVAALKPLPASGAMRAPLEWAHPACMREAAQVVADHLRLMVPAIASLTGMRERTLAREIRMLRCGLLFRSADHKSVLRILQRNVERLGECRVSGNPSASRVASHIEALQHLARHYLRMEIPATQPATSTATTTPLAFG